LPIYNDHQVRVAPSFLEAGKKRVGQRLHFQRAETHGDIVKGYELDDSAWDEFVARLDKPAVTQTRVFSKVGISGERHS
jgi:hypothetical protein